MLLDDVLLEIFDFYRNIRYDHPGLLWNWFPLVQVCRRWRQIIFESPHRLNLQILCTNGTPVRKNLGIWPPFPIILHYSQIALKLNAEDNVIAALEHRDRVCYVGLSGTGSQLGKMAAMMQEPFPLLTHLDLHLDIMCWRGKDALVLTSEFLGCSAPRLQEIILCRISFPALPSLLLSTCDLVTLKLLDIPTSGYISPEVMVACLASLPRLKVLAITYQDIDSHPDRIRPPPVTRLILPVLTDFEITGAFEYLEDLVAQIDSPQLERISIIYLDHPVDFQVTQLSEFIDRSIGPELTPSRRAHACFHYFSVNFTLSREHSHASYPGCDWPWRSPVTEISLQSLHWYMPDVAVVLSQLSAVIRTVVHLELEAEFEADDNSYEAYNTEWRDLLRRFPNVRTLHVSKELARPVFFELEHITEEMVAEVLPSLDLICLEGEPETTRIDPIR